MSLKPAASSDRAVIEIRRLESVAYDDFWRIMHGYTSMQRYDVQRESTPSATAFTIRLVDLARPYVRKWSRDESMGIDAYNDFIAEGLSPGAFEGDALVGLAIAERRDWNNTLWVWEFGVDDRYHRRGIGRRLMDELAGVARDAGLRAIVCETQNTNVNAVQFYFALGFELDGVDLSYYTNRDHIDGEIAFFMKRKLDL